MAERRKPPMAWLEPVAGAIGLVLTLSVVGLLIRHAVTDDDQPPAVTVAAERVVALPAGGYVVEFAARNRARTATAAQLRIEGRLTVAGTTETAEATLDYVPARSVKRGGLYFGSDPRRGKLELRPVGFSEP